MIWLHWDILIYERPAHSFMHISGLKKKCKIVCWFFTHSKLEINYGSEDSIYHLFSVLLGELNISLNANILTIFSPWKLSDK